MKELLEQIKNGQFKNCTLICGEEAYLRLYYRGLLLDALCPGKDPMNYNVFDGERVSEDALITQAQTFPFFAERRVIAVNNSGLFKSGGNSLAEALAELPEYTYIVFTESEVDKRTKLYKAVKSCGTVVECSFPGEEQLTAWILKMLKDAGLSIRREDMNLLLSRVGTDMTNIKYEVDKLINYCHGRTAVETGDIKAVVTEKLENRIFDMISAVTSKDRKKALSLYHDLLLLKEAPMRILYLLSRQYNQLLIIRELSDEGTREADIAKKAGVPPFALRKMKKALQLLDKEALKDSLSATLGAEEDVKSGRLSDHLSVELLLIQLCR